MKRGEKLCITLLLVAILSLPNVVAIDQAIIEDGVLTAEELKIDVQAQNFPKYEDKQLTYTFLLPEISQTESNIADVLHIEICSNPPTQGHIRNIIINSHITFGKGRGLDGVLTKLHNCEEFTFKKEYLRYGNQNEISFEFESVTERMIKVYPTKITGFGSVTELASFVVASQVQVSESFKIKATVKNTGKVIAKNVRVSLDLRSEFRGDKSGSVELYPGEEKEVVFNIRAPSKPGNYPLGYIIFNGKKQDLGTISVIAETQEEKQGPEYYEPDTRVESTLTEGENDDGLPITGLVVGGMIGFGGLLLLAIIAGAAYLILKKKE